MSKLAQRLKRLEKLAGREPELSQEKRLIDLPLAERQNRIDEIWKQLEERRRWLRTAPKEELEARQREHEAYWECWHRQQPAEAAKWQAILSRIMQFERGEPTVQDGP
jgi:hypothetical protein